MTTRTDAPTFEDVIAGWDEAITCQFPSIGPSGRCAQMGLVALDSGISLSAGARRWLRIWRRSLGDPEGNPFVEQTAPASGSP
jgi:hypothetical protein